MQIEKPFRGAATLPNGHKNADWTPAKRVTAKTARLCKLKNANTRVWQWMRRNAPVFGSNSEQVVEASERMSRCGLSIILRQYVKTGLLRLQAANFCKKTHLCSLCAAARAKRISKRYERAVDDQHKDGAHSYMITLTWPSGDNLTDCLNIGLRALRLLWNRKKVKGQGPFRNVLGIVAAVEVTKGVAGWHPHFHCIVTLKRPFRVERSELNPEWEALTGGQQVHYAVIKSHNDLREVFKYSLKPGETGSKKAGNGLTIEERVQAWLELGSTRLLRSYGCYRGLDKEPEDLTEGELDGDFVDWILLWMSAQGNYNVSRWKGTNRDDN